ncbi:MAG: phasin family protein [Candidatus Marinimicrobia bacterium]|nr:phasin family protein [Candidatus Neomarinimicrobiota bacterium]MCK4446667.1 phasin family protein [Candidatus Neomarinimicrobiota bacterium]
MFDLFKKAVLMGLGAVTITKEKVEQIVDELIKKGELAEGERSEAIRDLLTKAREQEKALNEKVSTTVKKTIEKLDLPSRQDIERLEEKIDDLKNQ